MFAAVEKAIAVDFEYIVAATVEATAVEMALAQVDAEFVALVGDFEVFVESEASFEFVAPTVVELV